MDVDFLYPVAGLAVGFLVGLTGVGGGALMTPLLIFGFGFSPAVAVGTDLLYAAITKAGGIWVHARQATVDWRIVRRMAAGSLPAAMLTLWWLGLLDTHTSEAEQLITTTLGLALIFTAGALLFRQRLRAFSGGWVARHQLVITVAVGAVLGVMVTLTSVGAGALGAAALFWLYPRLSAVRVVGTDIAHAVPLTAVAGIGHWQMGSVDWMLLGALLIGSLPGIYLGSRLSALMPDRILRPILATLLLLIGFRLVT